MRKLLFILGLFVSLAAMGQSWDAYYGYIPDDSITGRDSIQLLVIDAEKDSTYVLLIKQLKKNWKKLKVVLDSPLRWCL